jgi:hypothetical protein
VRYARVPSDLANCGCLNPETASTGGGELEAAKASEAEAAAELSKVKAEARQFLESVKNPTPDMVIQTGGDSTRSIVW